MLYGAADDSKPAIGNDEIVREAVERWHACKDHQGIEDERAREDIKFANADCRNAWAWPTKVYQARTGGDNELPCLTINQTRVYNDNIINSIAKADYGIKVRPVGGKASYKSAQMMQSLIRRIENVSKASSVFRKIGEQQVDGGIGYLLIETAYVSARSRDQEIYFKASRDPTGVYLDPWLREPDGSDANFGFICDRKPRKEFNRQYPQWKGKVGTAPLDSAFAEWLTDKEIMLVKYYRKKQRADHLVWYRQENGDEVERLASEIRDESGAELLAKVLDDIKEGRLEGGSRKVFDDDVEWFLIAGNIIVDKGDWPGKYIPICRCVGRELVIDGTLDRKGNTRAQIDPARMLNFNASSSVQYIYSQTKTQWLAPDRAVQGQEQWKTANVDNFAVLLYDDIDEEAEGEFAKIPPPQRIDPPRPSPAYTQGMQDAERQLMMINGQFSANPQEDRAPNDVASGKAINERKEAGELATYHFHEHMADMKRFAGVQLLDLIPKIYDSRRALHVIGEDGEKYWLRIEPNQDEVVQELQDEKDNEEAIKIAFNPTLGQYECVSDPGPDFATQRQDRWNAMTQILTANKELVAVVGDLLFMAGDFDGAEEIRERLLKEIKATKPYLFDANADPAIAAAQQQNQRLIKLNSDLTNKLAAMDLKLRGRDEKRDIEAFNADTRRLDMQIKAMKDLLLTPQQKAQMEHELQKGAHQHVYDTISRLNEAALNPGENGENGVQESGGAVNGSGIGSSQ